MLLFVIIPARCYLQRREDEEQQQQRKKKVRSEEKWDKNEIEIEAHTLKAFN